MHARPDRPSPTYWCERMIYLLNRDSRLSGCLVERNATCCPASSKSLSVSKKKTSAPHATQKNSCTRRAHIVGLLTLAMATEIASSHEHH